MLEGFESVYSPWPLIGTWQMLGASQQSTCYGPCWQANVFHFFTSQIGLALLFQQLDLYRCPSSDTSALNLTFSL